MVTGEPDAPMRRSWNDIHRLARRMAGTLARYGVGPGDSVGILAGLPADVAPATQAVWIRGAAVTMLHQPTPRTDRTQWGANTRRIADMISAKVVVIGAPFEWAIPVVTSSGATAITISELAAGAEIEPVAAAEHDIALQQLTSGSTGFPKAVRITHSNLFHNNAAIADRFELATDRDVLISWLPLFHDMGMIGFLTMPMQLGLETVNVTPMDFLRDPTLWARLIDTYRGTITAAPNFAYAILARQLVRLPEDALDLRSMRSMWNGAEPVDADTMAAFAEAGGRFGLSPSALTPCYGMAETTLATSAPDSPTGVVVDTVDADVLAAEHRALPASTGNLRRLVTLGSLIGGMTGRVVDAQGRALPARSVGVIQVSGPSVAEEYVTERGTVTARTADGWLDTGDIGYFTEDGAVVVCGRMKDVIIIEGRNIYPTDIERAAATVAGVRPGNVVAARTDTFGVRESFIVTAETERHGAADDAARIERQIVQAVFDEVGVRPLEVRIVAPGSVPKTSSGKLRRSLTVASADPR